jgi:hypothetical protein
LSSICSRANRAERKNMARRAPAFWYLQLRHLAVRENVQWTGVEHWSIALFKSAHTSSATCSKTMF